MEALYGSELKERFKAGRKEFSDIILQFTEFNDENLEGLIIRNSKIDYTQFRSANLKNAKFINCEMFFASFFSAELENTIFDKCKIDMTRFDSARLKNTKILNSHISYCLLMDVNTGEIDLRNTSQFKLITNPGAVTNEEIADALRIIGNHAEDLPIEIKIEIQRRISGSLEDFGRDPKMAQFSPENKPYSSSDSTYSRASNLYHAMNSFVDDMIKYGNEAGVYRAKRKYGK